MQKVIDMYVVKIAKRTSTFFCSLFSRRFFDRIAPGKDTHSVEKQCYANEQRVLGKEKARIFFKYRKNNRMPNFANNKVTVLGSKRLVSSLENCIWRCYFYTPYAGHSERITHILPLTVSTALQWKRCEP